MEVHVTAAQQQCLADQDQLFEEAGTDEGFKVGGLENRFIWAARHRVTQIFSDPDFKTLIDRVNKRRNHDILRLEVLRIVACCDRIVRLRAKPAEREAKSPCC